MFVSRGPGERFPHDETRGPELRPGLDLFRVVNRTGLQIRKGIGLDSEPCGRLYAGDVFYVNHSAIVPHHQGVHRPGTKGRRGQLRLIRLHVVAPRVGWVSGSSKWVLKFQDGGGRPGPIPLRSTLTDNCPVLMVRSPERNHSPAAKKRGIHGKMQGTHGSVEPEASTPRTKWLHSRGGVWPVAVSSVPGPKYFPKVPAVTGHHSSTEQGVAFTKEQRFLSNTTRYLSKGHERQARGMFSPGPAMYIGHDEVMAVTPRLSSTAPGSARSCRYASFAGAEGGGELGTFIGKDSPRTRRAVTAGSLGGKGSRRSQRTSGGAPYIGIKEREAAERHIGKAKAGTTGSHVMRVLLSSKGERERPDACFITRMGAESPGPASHFPDCSSISSRGCPVFASPTALDPAEWEQRRAEHKLTPQKPEKEPARSKTPQTHCRLTTRSFVRPKTSQVHRRWPSYAHLKDEGRISGNLGQDSPGPGTVNVANHDPFRAKSFLRTDVCHPPPPSSPASYVYHVPLQGDEPLLL